MTTPAILDLYRSDLRGVLQGLLALCVVLALAYGTVRVRSYMHRRWRRKARWQAGQRLRLLIESREQCAVLTLENDALKTDVAGKDREIRRLLAIRAKLDRACKSKHAELERAQDALRWAHLMIPPATTGSPPTLTAPLPSARQPLDLDLDVAA